MYKSRYLLSALITGGLLAPAPALAVDIPSTAAVDRARPASPSLPDLPAGIPTSQAAETYRGPRSAGAETVRFTLTGLTLKGNTIFSSAELLASAKPLLSREVALSEVYDYADALTARYIAAGYVMARVTIPPQESEGGRLLLLITEGEIANVTIEGEAINTKAASIVANRIRALGVVNMPALQQELLKLNNLPGGRFELVLLPAGEGRLNVALLGRREKAWQGTISFDNMGSRYLGPYLAHLSLARDGVLGEASRTGISASTATQPRELVNYSLSHTTMLFRPDLVGTLTFGQNFGEPGYLLRSSDVKSRSTYLQTDLIWHLSHTRSEQMQLSTGFVMRNSQTDLAGTELSSDHVRTLSAGWHYQARSPEGASTQLDATLTQGLPGFLGGSETGDDNLSREAASASFTKLTLEAQRLEQVGKYLSVYGRLAGQISNAPLYSAEEFGFGGLEAGRAYDSSEKTGDSGLSALVELRGPTLQPAAKLLTQPYLYADYGAVWNRDGLTTFDKGASVGAGMRFSYVGVSGQVLLAQPLYESEASTYPNNPGPRLLFSLTKEF